MKILNEPIKVMAVFDTNGKIEPVKFRLDDKVVRIEKIMKTYEENIIGNTSKLWAIIIAVGVNSSLKAPKGPFLERRRYTTKPINTGGILIRVSNNLTMCFFSLKFFKAVGMARVIPTAEAINVDVIETNKDNNVISITSLK